MSISDTELPVREILIKAAHKDPSFLCSFCGPVVQELLPKHDFYSLFHQWIMDTLSLLLLEQLHGSSCHLCLEIELIFQNLSFSISTFLGDSSDVEDSCD